jgi:endonuclease/exonuclease/phosphatase family metal-dependent hydrolase
MSGLDSTTLIGLTAALAAACAPDPALVEAPPLVDCALAGGRAPAHLRVVTYNIFYASWSSLEAVADTLQTLAPDLVALQEVDRGVGRSGDVDQAALLAERLGMQFAFAVAHPEENGQFGNAVLSRLPFARAAALRIDVDGELSARTALDVDLCVGDRPLRVLAAHADVMPYASDAQCRQLAAHAASTIGRGTAVLGDLNNLPDWQGVGALRAAGLDDVVARLAEGSTYQADAWARRLDHVLVDGPLAWGVEHVAIVESEASDHKPVLAVFDPRHLDD